MNSLWKRVQKAKIYYHGIAGAKNIADCRVMTAYNRMNELEARKNALDRKAEEEKGRKAQKREARRQAAWKSFDPSYIGDKLRPINEVLGKRFLEVGQVASDASDGLNNLSGMLGDRPQQQGE